MSSEQLVKKWFDLWSTGDFLNLPVADQYPYKTPTQLTKVTTNQLFII